MFSQTDADTIKMALARQADADFAKLTGAARYAEEQRREARLLSTLENGLAKMKAILSNQKYA